MTVIPVIQAPEAKAAAAAPPAKKPAADAAAKKPAADAAKKPAADAAAKKPAEKKAAPLKAAVKAKKEAPKKLETVKTVKGKGYKGKKLNLKFTIDCTHPVEDGIMNASDFVSDSKLYAVDLNRWRFR